MIKIKIFDLLTYVSSVYLCDVPIDYYVPVYLLPVYYKKYNS